MKPLKLGTKLALYHTFSKLILIFTFGAILPIIVSKVAMNHIDHRLKAKQEKVMKLIKHGDISEIKDDEDCSFGNYNLIKEEFVSIQPVNQLNDSVTVSNGWRDVGGDVFEYRILSSTFYYDNQPYGLELGEGLSSLNELNKTLQSMTLWIMLIITLITLLLDIGFTRYLMRPLRIIIEQKLKKMEHPTRFEPSPIATNTYDFLYLDRSLNDMMVQVKAAFLLEKEFMANVSHELLTPISILQNRFENMVAGGQLPPELEAKMMESQKTLMRLSKIIKALLMISNIENDQYLKDDQLELSAFIEEVAEEITDRMTEKNIAVSYSWESQYVFANCNRTLLFTLFFNLINNAIKYNKVDGSIQISGKALESGYVVAIQDTGRGIAKDQLELIFERFKRFKKIDNESYGLGLPIVKTIANFHAISIELDSDIDKCTTFKLFFP